jgi:prepilin-type N-terminal cleavage/methylation domain-containing protein
MPRLTSPGARRRRGFTLVELLVTIALLGVVGTIVAQMMMDQQRFYHATNEQMSGRRELRSAMSMVPPDLRGLSSVGGDILDFTTNEATFRATSGAAVICAKPNAFTFDVPPLNAARTTLTSWYTQPTVGDTLYAFRTDSMGAGGDSWSAHRVTAIQANSGLCGGSPFLDGALDNGKDRWRISVTPAIPDSVKVGSVLRFTRATRYQLTTGASGKSYLGRSERVNGAWSAALPIAGPFAASSSGASGVYLAMYDSLGAPVVAVADARRISRIDVTFRTLGAASSGSVGGTSTPKDSLAFRIALRNRQ